MFHRYGGPDIPMEGKWMREEKEAKNNNNTSSFCTRNKSEIQELILQNIYRMQMKKQHLTVMSQD